MGRKARTKNFPDGCREPPTGSVLWMNTDTMGRAAPEDIMAKYLLLKHYRGAPAAVNDAHTSGGPPQRRDTQSRHVTRRQQEVR